MKRTIAMLLVLVITLGLCACGSSNEAQKNIAGTYEWTNTFMWASVAEPYMGSILYDDAASVGGKMTITLNTDGTGTSLFTATENVTLTNQAVFDEMSHGTLTWSVDGDYINITFNRVTYYVDDSTGWPELSDVRRETSTTDTFELKGKQLINVSNGVTYTKIG